MGCSAAKNVTVEPMDNHSKAAHMTNGTHEKLSSPRRVSDVPPLIGEEPQTELLEAGNVNNVHKGGKWKTRDYKT